MATKASTSKNLDGNASVRHCIAALLSVDADKLPGEAGIYWFDEYKRWALENGYTLTSEFGSQTVNEKHIGLFNSEGTMYAVLMEGDKVLDNPTSVDTQVANLTNRIVFRKDNRQSLTGQEAKAKEDK